MYVGVDSGKRGDRGIRDNRGIGDDGLTVNDKKLDGSVSILKCRIKYPGSSGAHGDGGTSGISFICSVIQRGDGLWGKSKGRLDMGTYAPTLGISNHTEIPNKGINARSDLPWESA